MSSIQVEDHVLAALEANAMARGLSLSEYLAVVAAEDAHSETIPCEQERPLGELVAPLITEARKNHAEPRKAPANTMNSEFDAAMVEKYRKQGFNL